MYNIPVIHYCIICGIFTACIWYLIKDVGLSSSYLSKNIYKYRSIDCHWCSLYGILLMNISLKYIESTVNSALNLSINRAINRAINQQYNLRPLQSETAASRAEIAGSSSSRRTNPEKISARWQSQTATPDVRAFRKMVWQTNTWTRQENNMFKTVMREWAVYVLFKRSKNILY